MTWTQRALIGAVAGALAVLLLHPALQPYVWPPSASSPPPPQPLRDPRSPSQASEWVITGLLRLESDSPPTRDQALTLAEIALAGTAQEPENGFWWACQAVFQGQLGNRPQSLEAWRKAAAAEQWRDRREEQRALNLGEWSQGPPHAWRCVAAQAATGGQYLGVLGRAFSAAERSDPSLRDLREMLETLALSAAASREEQETALRGFSTEDRAFLAKPSSRRAALLALASGRMPSGLILAGLVGAAIWGLCRVIRQQWLRADFSVRRLDGPWRWLAWLAAFLGLAAACATALQSSPRLTQTESGLGVMLSIGGVGVSLAVVAAFAIACGEGAWQWADGRPLRWLSYAAGVLAWTGLCLGILCVPFAVWMDQSVASELPGCLGVVRRG